MSNGIERPQPGEVTVGITVGGDVVLITPGPETFFTPKQARNVAKIILDKASDAEKAKKGQNN
jgi:hypothetical protein